jgi:hypothetical protein
MAFVIGLQQCQPKPYFGAGDGGDSHFLLFERRQHALLQRGRAVAHKVAQDVGVHQKLDHPAIDSGQVENPELN